MVNDDSGVNELHSKPSRFSRSFRSPRIASTYSAPVNGRSRQMPAVSWSIRSRSSLSGSPYADLTARRISSDREAPVARPSGSSRRGGRALDRGENALCSLAQKQSVNLVELFGWLRRRHTEGGRFAGRAKEPSGGDRLRSSPCQQIAAPRLQRPQRRLAREPRPPGFDRVL